MIIKKYQDFIIFESKSYELVDISEMFPELTGSDTLDDGSDTLDDRKISDNMIDKIINRFPKLKVSEPHPFYIHRSACTTFSYDDNFNFDISEIGDEWFYVKIHFYPKSNGPIESYKCDQLEGLFELLDDIFSKNF